MKENNTNYSPKFLTLGIDLGSTQIKFGLQETITIPPCQTDYSSEICKFDGKKFKVIKGESLEELIKHIKQNYQEQREALEELRTDQLTILTITGLTNSLYVEYENKGTLILDDPSLTCELNEDQKKVIAEYLGIPAEEVEKKIEKTTLMKMLSLKNNPDLVQGIFDQGVNFENLRFSTFIGMVVNKIFRTDNLTIPQADFGAFGKKDANYQQLEKLLGDLGLLENVRLEKSPFIQTLEGIVFTINDFQGEANIVNLARNANLITNNSPVIAFDSVAKILHPKGKKRIGDEHYETQRMGGNVLKIIREIWKKTGFLSDDDNFYKKMDNYIEELLQRLLIQSSENQQFNLYYYPETDSPFGTLVLTQNGEKITIPITSNSEKEIEDLLNKIPEIKNEQNQLIDVLVLGMLFGIKEKINTLNSLLDNQNSSLYIYGGLVFNNHKHWPKLLGLMFSDIGTVRKINIENANLPASLSAKSKLDINQEKLKKEINIEAIGFGELKEEEQRVIIANLQKLFDEWEKNKPKNS